jgi:ribose 5-phosphate isomerase
MTNTPHDWTPVSIPGDLIKLTPVELTSFKERIIIKGYVVPAKLKYRIRKRWDGWMIMITDQHNTAVDIHGPYGTIEAAQTAADATGYDDGDKG